MVPFTSLFFWQLLIVIWVAFPVRSYSQPAPDSTSYYYQAIISTNSKTETLQAIVYFQRKLEQALKRKDTVAALYAQRLLVIGQYEMDFLNDSEETATNALKLLESLNDSPYTLENKKAFYINLGRVYRSLQNPKTALYYYDKVLALVTSKKDSIIHLNNRATVYIDMEAYDLALRELEQAFKKAEQKQEALTIAKTQDNLGFVQSKLGRPEGLPNLQAALALRLPLNDLPGIYSSYRHLTEYHLDKKEFTQAEAYAQKAYQTAKILNSASYLENAIANLIRTKNDTNFSNYLFLTDSLAKAKLAQENSYAGIKFEFEKEARRANANELEKEKQKRYKIVYQALGGVVLLSGIYLFFFLRDRNKKKTQQAIYTTETRISKKVHDEVANDVYHVMTKLQNNHTQDEALLDDLEQIYTKTRDISKESGAIEVHQHFDTLLSDLLLSYQSAEVSIITRNIAKIDWDALPNTKKTTLYRVLQELMTNMRKHSKATVVVLVFSKKGGTYQIAYTDNGLGTHLKKRGGLLNTENRMETINGRISFESEPDKGFKATITV